MKWLRRHGYLLAAICASGLFGTVLHASCMTDECTNIVFYGPSGNDWCKEYEAGQAQLLRSSNPDGGTRTLVKDESGDPVSVSYASYSACTNCMCTGVFSLKECHGATGLIGSGNEDLYQCCVTPCT